MTSALPNIAETSDNGAGCGAPPEIGRQRKRGAELEDAIRGACVAELAELGYGNLTIESVASRAQTGKASIYRRWPTKQQLVMDSVGCLMSGPLMRLTDLEYDDTVTTRDAILDLMVRVGAVMAGAQGDAMRSLMGESLRDEDFSGCFEGDFYDPRKQSLIRLLERGVARGEVRPEAIDEVVVEMIAGAMIHRILIRRQNPTKRDFEQMLDVFIMPAIQPGAAENAAVADKPAVADTACVAEKAETHS